MAALFIGVTMAFPNGLAGLVESHLKPWWARRKAQRAELAERIAAAHAAYPDAPPPRGAASPDSKLPGGVSSQRA